MLAGIAVVHAVHIRRGRRGGSGRLRLKGFVGILHGRGEGIGEKPRDDYYTNGHDGYDKC